MHENNSMKKEMALCDVCRNEKPIRLEIVFNETVHKICSEPCFVAFKFANNVSPEQCESCRKYFEQSTINSHTICIDDQTLHFCDEICHNTYINANRKIVECQWCKTEKYNFDMIKKTCSEGQTLMMCSINCLESYHASINDDKSRNYPYVMNFQDQFDERPINSITSVSNTPISDQKKILQSTEPINNVSKPPYCTRQNRNLMTNKDRTENEENNNCNKSKINGKNNCSEIGQLSPTISPHLSIISNVRSLAQPEINGSSPKISFHSPNSLAPQQEIPIQQIEFQTATKFKPKFIKQFIIKPAPVPEIKNKSTMCKPNMHTKGLSFKSLTSDSENQTDNDSNKSVIIPVPIPIYVPTPASVFSMPFPVAVPFPLPIPIPIFIPTTRKSADGIMKEMKRIQSTIPADPFEAEVLMMAEMIAGHKRVDNTDSESGGDDHHESNAGVDLSPEGIDTINTFGDEMLQMALKMATEIEDSAVDLEGTLTANIIRADGGEEEKKSQRQVETRSGTRSRKRQSKQSRIGTACNKRNRRTHSQMEDIPQSAVSSTQSESINNKPDANMCLKYTIGVNAWKQWVTLKNAELEKTTLPIKPFKTEILQLTADELNHSLCQFIKEVRKPNGSEYAPDTIFYLCLGIQQYLYENGRIDNIFTDVFYEKFTECLDQVAKKFSILYNDSHYIVTRVEEEHLWESKQLGAHSPHVLLSTLMFFNTKHFNLTTVDDHLQLSFSYIMKHWKPNPNQSSASKTKSPGSRNVLLRYYLPQSMPSDSGGETGGDQDVSARKKKVYEQHENEANPLRCPVKLYEFYLSKCPESVKTRNDVFYLLPERSCVPDSPVWYSTMPLERNALEKMLHRVKMVKEINVALLTN